MLQRISSDTRTTCPCCGAGCGLIARHGADGQIGVSGDPLHPANAGRLCSKGAALADTLSLDDRLLPPLLSGRKVDWDTALDIVADRFLQTIAVHGPDPVAFCVSDQILAEDCYVANKPMKGFIGPANIDTNSRLCMAGSVAGHKRAFGRDTVPCSYEDPEVADLVILIGSNTAWCHLVLFQRHVGVNQIADAVRSGCTSVDAVGAAVRAGTNCGSCRMEIRRIIDAASLQNAG